MDISVKGTKLKVFKGLDINQTVERDAVGQCITLQVRIPYNSLMCFEFPKVAVSVHQVGVQVENGVEMFIFSQKIIKDDQNLVNYKRLS